MFYSSSSSLYNAVPTQEPVASASSSSQHYNFQDSGSQQHPSLFSSLPSFECDEGYPVLQYANFYRSQTPCLPAHRKRSLSPIQRPPAPGPMVRLSDDQEPIYQHLGSPMLERYPPIEVHIEQYEGRPAAVDPEPSPRHYVTIDMRLVSEEHVTLIKRYAKRSSESVRLSLVENSSAKLKQLQQKLAKLRQMESTLHRDMPNEGGTPGKKARRKHRVSSTKEKTAGSESILPHSRQARNIPAADADSGEGVGSLAWHDGQFGYAG